MFQIRIGQYLQFAASAEIAPCTKASMPAIETVGRLKPVIYSAVSAAVEYWSVRQASPWDTAHLRFRTAWLTAPPDRGRRVNWRQERPNRRSTLAELSSVMSRPSSAHFATTSRIAPGWRCTLTDIFRAVNLQLSIKEAAARHTMNPAGSP